MTTHPSSSGQLPDTAVCEFVGRRSRLFLRDKALSLQERPSASHRRSWKASRGSRSAVPVAASPTGSYSKARSFAPAWVRQQRNARPTENGSKLSRRVTRSWSPSRASAASGWAWSAAADAAARDEFSEDDAWTLEVAGVAAALVWQQRRLTGQLLSEKATESDHLRGIATRMRELEEMKGHILNLAAHELRGPIAVIRGYLSLMSDGSIDETGFLRILPILLGKAAQMDGLITQMLEVARLEEGRLELKQESVDLERATREAVDVAALLAPAGLSIFFESGTEAVLVLGDPARVTTIIGNLLDNAIKYSPNGGQVRCKVGRLDARGFVRVSDPGLGIAPGDMSRLFTRFGRIVTSENKPSPEPGSAST